MRDRYEEHKLARFVLGSPPRSDLRK